MSLRSLKHTKYNRSLEKETHEYWLNFFEEDEYSSAELWHDYDAADLDYYSNESMEDFITDNIITLIRKLISQRASREF